MIVSIHQPCYLPWLPLMWRIARSDVHIVLDHVQFEKNGYSNRNDIRTPNGVCRLTVPVSTHGKFGNLILREVEIADSRWASKHLRTILQAYAKAPYLPRYRPLLESIFIYPWPRLDDLIQSMNQSLLFPAFRIDTPILSSTDLSPAKNKSDLILELCRKVNAGVYLSGPKGREYLDRDSFERAGIEIRVEEFRHPVYPQIHGEPFVPDLSCLDLLLNHGPHARSYLL